MKNIDIRNFREEFQLTQKELGEIAGVTVRAVQSWEQNLRNVPQSSIMLLNRYREDRFAKDDFSVLKEVSETYQKEGIPLIPLSAMAGFGEGESAVLEVDCERFVIPTFKGADFLITVKGSSMMPKYNSGDIVACKKLPLNDLFFQWNKVYVLDTVQGALVKRIKKGSTTESVLIASDNEKYEPFELHKNQINAVALVIGVIRLE